METFLLPNGSSCYSLSAQETRFIATEIFGQQQYLKHGITIEREDCIFDVGANIGLFTLFAKQIQPTTKIYAFEPITEIWQVLQQNIQLHQLENVAAFNYGLSSKNDPQRYFTFYPHMPGNSTAKPEEKDGQRMVMNIALGKDKTDYLFQSSVVVAETRTLSSVLKELDIATINLLKIDVEGDEYETLKGIETNDWKKIEKIVMEVHDIEGRLEQIEQLLLDHGFQVIIENNILPGTNNANVYAL